MKTITCVAVLLLVLALPTTRQLAKNASDSTDSPQQQTRDQWEEVMTTAAEKAEGYTMESQMTGVTRSGNTASENGEPIRTPPLVGSQPRSTTTTFPQYLNPNDERKNDKNNSTRASSVAQFHLTSTSLFAFPIGYENLLQHNTEVIGNDKGQKQSLKSQFSEYMQHNDTNYFKYQRDEDIPTTVLGDKDDHSVTTMLPTGTINLEQDSDEDRADNDLRTNDVQPVTTIKPISNNNFKEEHDEAIATTVPETNDYQSITAMHSTATKSLEEQSDEDIATKVLETNTDQSITTVQPTNSNNLEEHSEEIIVSRVAGTNSGQIISTTQPIYTNNLEVQSDENTRAKDLGTENYQPIIIMQPTSTNSFEAHRDEYRATIVGGTEDDQSTTTVQPTGTTNFEEQTIEDRATKVLGTDDDQPITNMQLTNTINFEAHNDGNRESTVLGTKTDVSITIIKTTGTINLEEQNDDDRAKKISGTNVVCPITTMQPTKMNYLEEHSDENIETTILGTNSDLAVTTMQPVDTNNLEDQWDEGKATRVLGSVGDQPITSMQPTNTNNLQEQRDEDREKTVSGSMDGQSAITMQSTDTNDFEDHKHEDVETTVLGNSDDMLFTKKHLQNNVNGQNAAFSANYNDQTTTAKIVQCCHVSATQVPLSQKPEKVTTTTTVSFKIPDDDKGVMQQHGETNDTKMDTISDGILTKTTQDVDSIPPNGTHKIKEQYDEFHDSSALSSQDVGTTTTSPLEFTMVPGDEHDFIQQNVEPTAKIFEGDYDGIRPTTPHIVSSTSGRNGKEIYGKFMQENVEPTEITTEVDFDPEFSTTPKYVNSTPITDNSTEQYDEFNAIIASSDQEVGMTTILPMVPGDDTSLKQQKVESATRPLETVYNDTEAARTQIDYVTPLNGTNITSLENQDKVSVGVHLPPPHHFPQRKSELLRLKQKADKENMTQQEHQSGDIMSTVHHVVTIMASSTPPTMTTNNDSVGQHNGRQNTSLISKPNENEPEVTPSSNWFPLPDDDMNRRPQGDISKGIRFHGTDNDMNTTMSFLTIFKILAALKHNRTMLNNKHNGSTIMPNKEENCSTITNKDDVMSDEGDIVTIMPNEEENFSTTTKKEDVIITPTEEEKGFNQTKSKKPSKTVSYKIHMRMLRALGITLGVVLVLFLIKFACQYVMKRRRGRHTEVASDNAGPTGAEQPSTSQAPTSVEPRVRFQDLLAREEY